MGSQTTSSGMRSDPVLELARRGAVQLAVGGGVILSITSLVQVLLGEPAAAITLVAAIPTTVIAVAMLGQERPNVIALLSLITTFALAAEVFAAVRGETAYVAGIGAEVVVFGLGMLAVFVARKHPVAVGAGFLTAALAIVLVAQIHLNGPTLEIVSDIFVMLAVLGTLMYLVIRVMQSLSESRARYVDLAKVIPVATFELDVSRVLKRLNDFTGPEFAALASSHAQNELYAELMAWSGSHTPTKPQTTSPKASGPGTNSWEAQTARRSELKRPRCWLRCGGGSAPVRERFHLCDRTDPIRNSSIGGLSDKSMVAIYRGLWYLPLPT